jgi:hypothetical protein
LQNPYETESELLMDVQMAKLFSVLYQLPIVGFYVFVCVCVCVYALFRPSDNKAVALDFLFQHSVVNIIYWDLYGWVVLQLCSMLRLIIVGLKAQLGWATQIGFLKL